MFIVLTSKWPNLDYKLRHIEAAGSRISRVPSLNSQCTGMEIIFWINLLNSYLGSLLLEWKSTLRIEECPLKIGMQPLIIQGGIHYAFRVDSTPNNLSRKKLWLLKGRFQPYCRRQINMPSLRYCNNTSKSEPVTLLKVDGTNCVILCIKMLLISLLIILY